MWPKRSRRYFAFRLLASTSGRKRGSGGRRRFFCGSLKCYFRNHPCVVDPTPRLPSHHPHRPSFLSLHLPNPFKSFLNIFGVVQVQRRGEVVLSAGPIRESLLSHPLYTDSNYPIRSRSQREVTRFGFDPLYSSLIKDWLFGTRPFDQSPPSLLRC